MSSQEIREMQSRLTCEMVALGVTLVALLATIAVFLYTKPAQANSVHDGRVATCGITTEDGVTEYVTEFRARCDGVFGT